LWSEFYQRPLLQHKIKNTSVQGENLFYKYGANAIAKPSNAAVTGI
jgi:hypothetical protein